MKEIAIIGAGAAGLTAAWRLRTADCDVQIFEKSRGYTGRAATRSHGDTIRYDFGANYITRPPDRIRRLLTEDLPTDALATIDPPVWTFDAAGTLAPGDPESNAAPRWTYAHGINTLGKVLVEEGNLSVRRTTRIHHLSQEEGGRWRLHATNDESFGPFDAVLCTPPAPQTTALLQASTVAAGVQTQIDDCIAALSEAAYNPQFVYVFGLSKRLERPGVFHALLNTDRMHAIAWMSFEDDKPGRVPAGQTVLNVQMSPRWTAERVDEDPATYTDTARQLAADVLGRAVGPVAWTDAHRWRYAAPRAAAPAVPLDAAATVGLYFAGDYRAGKGRVALAMDSGWTQAERIRTG